MKKFTLSLLSGLLLTSCAALPAKPTHSGDRTPPVEEDPKTTLEIGYIALDDNGASGPLVGCGDSEVLIEKSIDGKLNEKEKVEQALALLFAEKSQFHGEAGLYNALYQSDLKVDSVSVDPDLVSVALSGNTQLGGECDDPRFVDQIKATVENNVDKNAPREISITVNGKDLADFQNLSGE